MKTIEEKFLDIEKIITKLEKNISYSARAKRGSKSNLFVKQ